MVGRTTPRGRSCWPRTSLNCYWLQPMLTGTPGTSHVGAWPARTEPAPVSRAPAFACGPAHPCGWRTRRARRRPADGAPRRRRTQASLVRPVHAAGQRSARAARRGPRQPQPGRATAPRPPQRDRHTAAFRQRAGWDAFFLSARIPLTVPRTGHGCGAGTETTRASVLDSPAFAGDRSASSLESVREPGWAQCC